MTLLLKRTSSAKQEFTIHVAETMEVQKKKNLYSRGVGDERHTVDWSNTSRTICRVDNLESSSSTQLEGIELARERLQGQESLSSQEALGLDFQHPHRVDHAKKQLDEASERCW